MKDESLHEEEFHFDIAEAITEKLDNSLLLCFQCAKCTDGCPLAFAMDIYPHEIIRLLLFGLENEALKSSAIWVCSSCYTCTTRCPNEVDVAGIMDYLKQKAISTGVADSATRDVQKFHETFMKTVERFGRVNEPYLLMSYFLDPQVIKKRYRKGLVSDDIRMGISLLTKGRIKLVPAYIETKTRKEIDEKHT